MNLLKSWFLKVINKPIMEAENKGKILGRLEFEEERKKENMKINMFEIEKHIGKNPVIVLSNEWCNPIVADIKSVVYENGVVYEVFDYITGETMFGSNTVMPFTIQKLKIVEKLTSQGMILPLVTKTAYNTGVSIPTSTVKPVATWVADGATSPSQKKTVGNVVFAANKLRCAVGVSFNLENMSLSAFEAAIVQNIADAMTIALEQAIVSGDGAGKPKGILAETAPAGQSFDVTAIDYKTMVDAEAAVPAAYENGAVYVMSKKTFMAFVGMVDSQKQPIARVNYGINGAADRSLLGRKVVICDYLPSFDAATAGQTFAFIFKMDDYVLNTAFNVTLRQYEDNVTDDIVRKAIMLADGKVVDANSLVVLNKKATA